MLAKKSLNQKVQVNVSQTINQDAEFWRNHVTAFQASGLSRRNYCLNHDLVYHRFSYWYHKLMGEQTQSSISSSAFLPVHLASSVSVQSKAVLCTLELGDRKRLLIHDEIALKAILNSWS